MAALILLYKIETLLLGLNIIGLTGLVLAVLYMVGCRRSFTHRKLF